MPRMSQVFASASLALAIIAQPSLTRAEDGPMAGLDAFLAAFAKGDVETMVAAHTGDAVFVTPQGVLTGRDQIRGAIAAVIDEFGQPGATFEVVSKGSAGDVAQLVWTGASAKATYKYAVETYVFIDGMIVAHTFAADVAPKSN